ncbi:hypothetical protein ACFY15_00545 [Streptomyces sp. NPDC001373]|uniref:hypothetical protein n=1 Tax=Streptomyces sp. NPDC001373 TaxID=3364565 RepID=UPI0036A0FBA4
MYPTLFTTPGLAAFAEEVDAERSRQLAKFGDQRHPDMTGDATAQCDARLMFDEWAEQYRQINNGHLDQRDTDPRLDWTGILLEEVYEALAEPDPARLRAELIQIAAICQAWVSDIDRRPLALACQCLPATATEGPLRCDEHLVQRASTKEARPARRTADTITDNDLDELYARIDTLTAVCRSNRRAYAGAIQDVQAAEQRAKQAEAALGRVRAEHDRIAALPTVDRIRAAIDEPQAIRPA